MLYIIPKHDVDTAWKTTSFIPRLNELIVITDKHEASIGDGVTPFKDLKRFPIPEALERLWIYGSNTQKPSIEIDLSQRTIDEVEDILEEVKHERPNL